MSQFVGHEEGRKAHPGKVIRLGPWALPVELGAPGPGLPSLVLSPVTVAPVRWPVRAVLGGAGRLAAQFIVAERDSV